MDFVINVAYGGESMAQTILVGHIRKIRRELKESFRNYDQEGLGKIKLFLFVNGDLTSYYDKTGLYQPVYYQKKQEYSFTICIDTDSWVQDQDQNLSYFIDNLKSYLAEAANILKIKLMKKKIDFDSEMFLQKINAALSFKSADTNN